MTPLTGETITDEEIRELRRNVKPLGVAHIMCSIALGEPLPAKTVHGDSLNWSSNPLEPSERVQARTRCAMLVNARRGEAP